MMEEIAGSRLPQEHISIVFVSGFKITSLLIFAYGQYVGNQVEWLTLVILAVQGS